MTNSVRPDFALNPMAALVVAYNTVADVLSFTNVNKFSDKGTAVARLNKILDAAHDAGFAVSYLPNGAISEIVKYRDSVAVDQATGNDYPDEEDGTAVAHSLQDETVSTVSGPEAYAAGTPIPPAPAPAAEPASVGGLTTLELSHRIEVLVENPKRRGSRARSVFDLYRTGQTGEEFVLAVIAAGMDRRVALSNLHWDIDHGFIYLGADVEAK